MILITGATGNTGSQVLEELLKIYSEEKIVSVSRKNSSRTHRAINMELLDLADKSSLEAVFQKYRIKSIIHIANIRYSNVIMDLANKYKVDKVVLVHTTGKYSKYRAYSNLYNQIEDHIMSNLYSDTKYVILRPTMIYGNERDHNMHKLIRFLKRVPIFPVFGDGLAKMQPVYVNDLAMAIINAHEQNHAWNEDFDLSGGSVVTYRSVLDLITKGLNKKVFYLHVPLKPAILLAKLYRKISSKPFISVEQIERLQEDKCYSNEKARELLEFRPRSFEEGILLEIERLRTKGLI